MRKLQTSNFKLQRHYGQERELCVPGIGLAFIVGLWMSPGMSSRAAEGLPDTNAIPALLPPRPELPASFWEQHGLLLVLGSVLALVLFAGLVFLLVRPRPPVPIPPADVARDGLERLRNQPETGELLSRISQILRHYFALAFALPPGEMTTTEFCTAITTHPLIGAELASDVAEFLRKCDQRKFSPGPASEPLGAVSDALRLIDPAEARRNPKPTQSHG